MPTYSYECKNCDHKFDLFQRMTADPSEICPECNQKSLRRLIGAGAGIIFKGSGFYCTDYRSKNYQEGASVDCKSSVPIPDKSGSGAKPIAPDGKE